MASQANLETKKAIVAEIIDNIKNNDAVVLFTYQGLTVAELSELRVALHECGGEAKIYKNTLLKIALDELKINLDGFLEGPNAIMFGKDLLGSIKALDKFAKEHDKVGIRVGIISGDVADCSVIKEYASIPSRDGLLTMLAGGMIQYVRDLAIGLNLYAEQLEK